MSHLLAISVGPVQEFIAAARRTRDLWFGSYLLSEISRRVAESVQMNGGKLIFPSNTDAENVANIILAELESGDPEMVAKTAKEAAENCWKEYADSVKLKARDQIDQTIWERQWKGVVETYSAWVVTTGDYTKDRKKLMRLLAGRKNLRDFEQALCLDVGRQKSSLDGQRESVLLKSGRRDDTTNLRLSNGEQLDIVGVVKRLGQKSKSNHQRYSSVARIAAETWLEGVKNQPAFKQLKDACSNVKGLNQVPEPHFQYFPFEGTVIFKDRHVDLRKELGLGEEDLNPVVDALKKLGGEPNPYLAILVADGDSMGKKLSEFQNASEHKEFSRKLAAFAKQAAEIVTQEDHRGVLIYAGGDDVLAFLPVHTCLQAARKLHDKFESETGMTLSVGVAIGHFMENLEDLLEYGRAAEKAAKQVTGKDALAVRLHKRGGAPIKFAASWNTSPVQRINHFATLMKDGTIPTKLPYELRTMATLYERWPEELAEQAIKQDLIRLIAKKASESSKTVKAAMDNYIQDLDAKKLLELAEEMLIARQIKEALTQAEGKR